MPCARHVLKPALSHEAAIQVMQREADSGMLDPQIVRAFVSMVGRKQMAASGSIPEGPPHKPTPNREFLIARNLLLWSR